MTWNQSAKQWLQNTFQSMENRNFRVYAIGQVISIIGTWMQMIALPWLVYKLTDSPAALGMATFANTLPMLLFSYPGGILADSFNRRKILIACQALAMIQSGVLAIMTLTGNIDMTSLLVLAFIGGTITAVSFPARQSFAPDLVEPERLTNALALSSAIWNTCRMLGPALAGVVIALWGEGVCFALNAVSFLAPLITLHMIRTRSESDPQAIIERKKKGGDGQNLLTFLKDPRIASSLLMMAIVTIFGTQYNVLMPVIVDKFLHGSATTMGFMACAGGIGALSGSLLVAGVDPKRLRYGIGYACLVLAVAVLILAMSSSLAISLFGAYLAGAAGAVQLNCGQSAVQLAVSPGARGRIMGAFSVSMLGVGPLAGLMAGGMASQFGLTITLCVSGTAVLLFTLVYFYLMKFRAWA